MTWKELRRHIPNALTILRFAAIPVFVWLYLEAGDGAAWGAGVFFAARRSPTSSTATSPAAGTSSRASARSPTRSRTG